MSVHFDKSKTSISLETRLDDESEVLEERDDVIGCSVWRQVSNVTSGLPIRRLVQDHLVTCYTMCWELMVAERRRRRHAHGLHRLLLSN